MKMKKEKNGAKIDMLNGSIWNKLPLFALPVAATAILEQLFNASDLAVVGNFTGDKSTIAVAAVGANSPVIGLILNLFIGVALGANVIIANAIGSGDEKTVHKAVHTSIIAALLGGAVIALLGELSAGWIMNALNLPAEVYPYAMQYLRIYLLGMPVIFLYNFEAAIFRSVGDTRSPLIALFFSGLLNVALNLFFVIVLKMTVSGVATATVISNLFSSAILLRKLIRSDKIIKVDPKKLRIHRSVFLRIMRIGMPAGLQGAVFSFANIVVQSAINSLGTDVIAASSAAFNLEILAYYIINSFAQACTTFVGQNFGAKKMRRCRRTLMLSLLEDTAAAALAIGIVLAAGKPLLSIFNSDPAVISIGYTRLIYIFSGYFFSMLYEVMSGYMRGFGISFVPALLTTLGVCGIRLTWIKFVFPTSRTFETIMTVYPISLAATAMLIMLALLFTRPAHKFERMHGTNDE